MSRRWIVLSLVFFGIVICYIDRGNLGIAAPSIMQDFRIQPATMGVLLSAFFWTYALFQLPAGALVDRFGIRRSYAVGFFVWSIASASIALCPGAGDIIGLRMLLGLAESVAPLASIAFIRNNFAGKDQGLPMSIYIAGQNIGPALGALVGAILLDRYGWRMMFAMTGLGALIWVPCWLGAAPSDRTRAVRQAEEAAADLAAPRQWTWRMLLTNRTFWAMTVSILLSSYYWYFVLTWIPSYLIFSRGFSTLGMGRVVSIALFTMAVVNVLAGSAVDKLAARIGVFRARLWFGVVGYAGTGAILLLLIARDRSWALPILTFSMCATGIGNSNYWTISQHVPPKSMVGRTIGLLNTGAVVAGAAAPIVTGWILGPQKQFGPAILVAGACPVLASVCLIIAGSTGLERLKILLAGKAYADS
ncbi:MAG TPA: MFS transporter [Terriglobia bacterium]|nr:MFS transporter [Terriglobia bacterium]